MKRNILIGLALFAALMCACGVVSLTVLYVYGSRVMNNAFNTDPKKAAEVGKSIADYTLPEGMQEQFSMDLLGYFKLVAIGAGDVQDTEGAVIMFMQFPANSGLTQADMEKSWHDNTQKQSSKNNSIKFTEIDQKTVKIRGQDVDLTISEGTSDEGVDMRQMTGVFSAKSGAPTLIAIMGTVAEWDKAKIDAFLNSIK